jgi:single-strand DNA-binding protein
MDLNLITLSGGVGQDPEFRTTASGTSMVKFSLANHRGYGDKKNTLTWFNCTAFGKVADFVSKYVKKGSRLIIVGEMQINKSDDGKIYPGVKVTEVNFEKGNIKNSKPGKGQEPTAKEQPSFDECRPIDNEPDFF